MAIVLSFRVIALIMFRSQVLGGWDAMSLLHLFKLPHNDAEQNQVLTLFWLHDNTLPVF